jgi:ketosteroid isomerase-like protein
LLNRRSLTLLPTGFLLAAADDPVACLEAWRSAMLKGDTATLEAVLHDELLFGHSNGMLETKQDILKAVSTKQVKYEVITTGKQTLISSRDMAMLRGDMTVTNSRGGAASQTFHINVLHVFVRDRGRWRMIGRQATRLIPPG